MHYLSFMQIEVEGIFSDKERKIQHEKQAQRHTTSYIHQQTTKLGIINKQQVNKENNNNNRVQEQYNPILMIGQIHAERANNIEEMIMRKRKIKGDIPADTFEKQSTNNTINENMERLRQLFPETSQSLPPTLPLSSSIPNPPRSTYPSSSLAPAHPHWQALLAIDRSRACLDLYTKDKSHN